MHRMSNLNFGPLIKHDPHWINYTNLTFTNEKNRYFRGLYKIWNKIIHFTWKKRWNVRHIHGKNEEKGELWKFLEWILKVQMWYPDHTWALCINKGEKELWQLFTLKHNIPKIWIPKKTVIRNLVCEKV
jgi:hypothetical protein